MPAAKWLGAEAPGALAVDGKGGKAELIEKVTRWIAAGGRNVTQPGEIIFDICTTRSNLHQL